MVVQDAIVITLSSEGLNSDSLTPRTKVFPIRNNNREDIEQSKLLSGQQLLQRNESNTIQEEETKTTHHRAPLKFLDRNQKQIEGDYSFTVDSMNTGGVTDLYKVRRLTPKECERLQGFPDDWTLVKMPNGKIMSDTQRYKMMGNAVTVNVVVAVVTAILT